MNSLKEVIMVLKEYVASQTSERGALKIYQKGEPV